ncbi:MAG TPA: threonine aldolase family protein [Bradyrhizobium sp.]|nr:threonine aldolase family protein [Bradyrhizobium sp.]
MTYTPPPRDPNAPPIRINLLSDTQTRPTPAMREAIARAEVGDEQIGDDPTVNLLCERVADLLGKQAAVFLPSGTMCNVAATLVHCRPGDEILAHETAHIIAREGGAHAALGGFQITPLKGADGKFSPDTFRAALHPRSRYQPPQTVVSVEQTANIGGGTIWNKADLDDVVKIARSGGLATHMDGARLMNACVASGIAARDMTAGWDSAWIDFSKGLGAPVGAVIAGSRDFIDEVWRWKQRLGGSMRQAGICAAACVFALDHHVDRLADDHANARALARGLSQIAGIEVQQPETNLVFFNPDGAGVTGDEMVEALRKRGVRLAMMDGRIRACTHLDVSAAMIEETIGLVRETVRGREPHLPVA